MTLPRLPPELADEMLEILFRESPPFSFKELLVVGAHLEEFDAALDRYVAANTGDRPNVSSVATLGADSDPESVADTTFDGTFLSEIFGPKKQFDYIVGVPPDLPWADLDPERRREIAGFSPHIEPGDQDINTGVLYLDRANSVLAREGRAVILGQTEIKMADTYAGFRGDIVQEVRDVEAVDQRYQVFDDPWFILALERGSEEPFDIDDRAQWADPSEIEQQLATTATTSREQITVEDIMTPLSKMAVYNSQDDASKVYLDMLYEDFDGSLVYEDSSAREELVGYVARQELTFDGAPPIESHTEPLTSERCISPDSTIDTVIRALADQRFLFPGQPDGPRGIVTRYDLNRLPVYHWLYDRFARLKIKLRELIRESDWKYENSDVQLRSKGVGDLVPDHLANDKLSKLVEVIDEAELRRAVLPDIRGYDATLDDLVELRNAVAHYNVIVHTMSDRSTLDEDERGVGQLRREIDLLLDII